MNTSLQRESRLLEKARQHGLAEPEDLERLAIERGCDYYDLRNQVRETVPQLPRAQGFTNEELAIALLVPPHRSLLRTRMGAAMIGAPGNDAHKLVSMAVEEGCADLVHHIAECGHQVEAENDFWTSLASSLNDQDHKPEKEGMPHLSRFVEMTGISRGKVGTQMRWIRPSGGAHA